MRLSNLTTRLVTFVVLLLLINVAVVSAQEGENLATGPDDVLDLLSGIFGEGGRYAGIPQEQTADGAYVLGYPDAEITIVAFEDFLCPHCHAYEPTLQQFIDEFVVTGRAKVEYRMMITAFTTYSVDDSYLMGRAVECAAILNNGDFWGTRDVAFEVAIRHGSVMSDDLLHEFADALSIDYNKMIDCSESAGQILIDATLGHESGVPGAPSIMVRSPSGEILFVDNNPRLSQPTIDDLRAVVEGGLPPSSSA